VAPQRAELDVPGVGVGVEVDHRDPPVPEDVGHALHVGIGNRVVPAENHGDRARAGDLLDGPLQRRQGDLDVPGEHLHVAGVEHPQVAQTVGPQGQRRTCPVVRKVVGHPDRLRPEAGARPVGGAAVERCAEDDDVSPGIRARIVQVAPLDTEEGDVRAVLAAVARHPTILGADPQLSRLAMTCLTRV